MKFSTEAVKKMAEVMVDEMERIGIGAGGIREVETGMRELLRAVGAEALGRYLEGADEQEEREAVRCECGDELTPANAQDILEVLDEWYGQAATIVASQIPFTDWFSLLQEVYYISN